jgi:hypothetical protein
MASATIASSTTATMKAANNWSSDSKNEKNYCSNVR